MTIFVGNVPVDLNAKYRAELLAHGVSAAAIDWWLGRAARSHGLTAGHCMELWSAWSEFRQLWAECFPGRWLPLHDDVVAWLIACEVDAYALDSDPRSVAQAVRRLRPWLTAGASVADAALATMAGMPVAEWQQTRPTRAQLRSLAALRGFSVPLTRP